MKKITFLLVLLNMMSLKVFLAVSCEMKEIEPRIPQEPQILNLNFTPCKQSEEIWKSSKSSGNVEIEFTDRGVEITYYDFGVPCDFTTVNVTFTFVNGVLNITQYGDGDADCYCPTDVSYTISGIFQNQVNAIFINGVQVYPNEQFPSPQNFQVDLTYIEWGDWGFCAGEPVYGPYHCTSTQWDEPNLAGIESQLVGYRIYNYPTMIELEEIPFDEGQIIEQTVETGLTTGGGYQGYIWVTAVYSEPDGESEPSNVVFCRLPLGINKNEIKSHLIFYNSQMKTIEITGVENVASINIFGIEGRLIAASESNKIDVKHLTKGVYIIKVTTKTGKIISEKLIIE